MFKASIKSKQTTQQVFLQKQVVISSFLAAICGNYLCLTHSEILEFNHRFEILTFSFLLLLYFIQFGVVLLINQGQDFLKFYFISYTGTRGNTDEEK